MAISAPTGTRDFLPDEALFWQQFKATAAEVFGTYGYLPIETPTLELTELFVRGIGEATDVVSKEMFTAISGENLKNWVENGRAPERKSRLSLRPEGTAGVVRAVVQHDLVPQGAAPAKLMYAGPMFRAENPQKGRQRQFNQVGVECLGAEEPTVDAEAIIMLMRFFQRVGIPSANMTLLLNSMGCEKCRPAYRDLVKAHLDAHSGELCDTCRTRAEINPLRAFDCKNESCAKVMEQAPKITDHLCDECKAHYETVKALLDGAGVAYVEDASLVRGLDYYTRTVFEVQADAGLGSQNAIGGGGRYDKLAEEVGGRPTPGLGFALGFERCALALEALGVEMPQAQQLDLFVACVNDEMRAAAFGLVQAARDRGYKADMDHQHRSLKSQFKLADKLNAAKVAVLGPDEMAEGKCQLRDMGTHEQLIVGFDEVVDTLGRALA